MGALLRIWSKGCPGKLYERLFTPIHYWVSFTEAETHEACLHALLRAAFLEEEHGRERRRTGDSRDLDQKKAVQSCSMKKKINAPVLWEPKRLAWLGTQAALSFSSGFLIHLAAVKHVEPQHFRFPRQGPVLGFCLQCSQVLLCEILEKMTLKTIFAPVGCEKLQQRLQIQLLNKIIVSQKHPPVGILP